MLLALLPVVTSLAQNPAPDASTLCGINNCAFRSNPPAKRLQMQACRISPSTVNYTAFNGTNYLLKEFVGKYTSVLISDADLQIFTDSQACELVDQADFLYATFKELMGVEPLGDGPLRIAFVPTCGGGCGQIGSKGVELGPYFASGTAWFARGDIPDLYPYLVHEMTHNFDRWSSYIMFGQDIAHAWTSFMDVYVVAANQQGQPPNSGGSPGYSPDAFLKKRIDDLFMPYLSAPGTTWQTCIRNAACTNINATQVQGGFAARLAQLLGVAATQRAMLELSNAANTRALNPGSMTPDQKNDLLLECFSRGARTNLSCVISPLHWSISPGMQSQLNTLFGTNNSLCADADSDGYSTVQGDFDDANPAIHPGAAEVVDGLDNDCNGIIDDILISESGDFPNNQSSALSVPFPCRIFGTISSASDDDDFKFTLSAQTKVRFSLRSSGSFAGWLFIYDASGGWLKYAYCSAGSQSDLDIVLATGHWRFSVSQNVSSSPGPYALDCSPFVDWPTFVYPGKPSLVASNVWHLVSPPVLGPLAGISTVQARFWASGFGWLATNTLGPSNITSLDWVAPSNLPPDLFTYRVQFYQAGISAARVTEALPLSGGFPLTATLASNGDAKLAWSAVAPGLALYSSSLVGGPWNQVPAQTQFTNGQFSVSIPRTNENLKLFRLQGN